MTDGRGCGRTAGFSLIEMLVVLAILAMAAGIGIPSIRNIVTAQRLDDMAGRIANEIALLRTEAQRTGRVTRLVYDGGTNRFVSSRAGASPLAMAGWVVGLEAGTGGSARTGELRFLPDGGCSGGRITLSQPGGSRILTVSRATGIVRQAEAVP